MKRAWFQSVAGALLAAMGFGCDADRTAAETSRFSTIVVVGVDGMRGDHLSRSGYPRPTTPFLDALAERALVFDRAYAASSRSLSSYASLMTGVSPGEHGIWQAGEGLDPEMPTLAEAMSDRGYRTAAFVSTRREWYATGLVRGFDHFSAPGSLHETVYRRGGETIAAAIEWLDLQPEGEPLFVWIQVADPRKPFDPLPNSLANVVADSEPEDLIAYKLEQHQAPFGYFNYENRHILRLVNRYDGELRSADDALSRLYAALGSGGGAGALWVITSPHGMGLGNHLWAGASRQIYETQVRVPLFFHTPGGELTVGVNEAVVSQLELGQVVLDLVDSESVAIGALFAAASENSGGAFVQRGSLGKLPRKTGLIGQPVADARQQDAWVEGRWKLVRRSDGSEQLFDVAADPYEKRDVLADAPTVDLERLRAALAAQHSSRGLRH